MLLRQFEGTPIGIRYTPAELATFEDSLVADLRTTSSRYPHDPDVGALVTRLDRSPKFRERWALRSVAQHQSGHKVVEHP
ncbi:hypothetical protein [Streptomyces sp. NPDC127072]|uniref:MmyB family transcriptional regulator n=1 Tax=Streptomyces sp. NPDC127072 TaxID=3347129 RepID=UPI0036511786